MTEAQSERLAIMLEAHPDVTIDAVQEAALAYRDGHQASAKFLARREQDAGRDGRQIMRCVQWLASTL